MASMTGSHIAGWGIARPRNIVTNSDLAPGLGVDAEWIESRTGVLERSIASSQETTSSLAADAIRGALDCAEMSPSQLDAIVIATVTPDYRIPATAPIVQAALGVEDAFAFDVVAGCSGFLYALRTAVALVADGACRTVAVCGSDTLSRVTDYTDRNTGPLFADGAGVMIISADGEAAIGPFVLGSDGGCPELLWIPPDRSTIEMKGRVVFHGAVRAMTESIERLLLKTSTRIDDYDFVVAHQANRRILDAISGRLGIPPHKIVCNIEHWGNTSAASIPIALAETADAATLRPGHRVLLVSFGAGFTWGAAALTWTRTSKRLEAVAS